MNCVGRINKSEQIRDIFKYIELNIIFTKAINRWIVLGVSVSQKRAEMFPKFLKKIIVNFEDTNCNSLYW